MSEIADRHSKLVVFTGIERAKFRRPVLPGDQIRFEIEALSVRSRAGRMEGKAYVDGKLACEATLTCRVVPKSREQGSEEQAAAGAPAAGAAQESAE
jgi:3-hydroxyacyl-[acyl-carrier-protein] dehydratase